MPDFNLDDFKNTWQQQDVSPKYDNSEILKMLNKKSRNYVKYIFWISVAEFLLFLGITIYYIFFGDDTKSFLNILENVGIEKTNELKANIAHYYFLIKVISLLITAYFVVRFFINYRKINVESNLKKFILEIIQFKKTVNLFILVNLGILLVSTVALTCFTIYTINNQNVQLSQSTLTGLIVGTIITTLISLGLVWIYYRLVYGIILGRLNKNLNQLKEIENNTEEIAIEK